jgi:hypothetical protein
MKERLEVPSTSREIIGTTGVANWVTTLRVILTIWSLENSSALCAKGARNANERKSD